MKRFLGFAIAAFALVILSACGGKGDANTSNADLIIGTWQASEPITMSQSGMTMTFSNLKSNYKKDQTSSSSANLKITGGMLPQPVELSYEAETTWSIDGNMLSETITDADIQMKKKISGMPDLGAIFSQQMKAQGASKSTIIALDADTLTVKAESTGLQVTMRRK